MIGIAGSFVWRRREEDRLPEMPLPARDGIGAGKPAEHIIERAVLHNDDYDVLDRCARRSFGLRTEGFEPGSGCRFAGASEYRTQGD